MYERIEQSVSVEWNPDDEQTAKQAMKDVNGTGVPDTHTLPDDAPISLSEEKATAVRERYNELVSQS